MTKYINNKSGCTGVSYHARSKRWRAERVVNGVCHYLGTYKKKEDAIAARKAFDKGLAS